MKCIACGREGHCSSSCPQQLWRWAAPLPSAAVAAAPAPAPRRAGTASSLLADSHDRAAEPWVHLR